MSMKPGCVVFDPSKNHWCVLVESRMTDGTIRRFMSFHDTYEDAHGIEKAHKEAHADELNTTVSLFEYDYIANEIELATVLMVQTVEDILSRAKISDIDEGDDNDCED
ncbi:MAG: hypothetical protein HXN12_08750 [Porphyromonadaceae bacterium]|nr:hypothetical protein [Porphyromonadaceae bacterium]